MYYRRDFWGKLYELLFFVLICGFESEYRYQFSGEITTGRNFKISLRGQKPLFHLCV